MKEKLKALWDILLEKIPHKNYTPEQKASLIKQASVVSCVICAAILLLMVVVLFPLGKVEIETNDSNYTNEQVLDALDAGGWTPFLSILPGQAEKRLLDNLLYLESAEVKYAFPNGLRISVKEQKPLYYFYYKTQLDGSDHSGWMAIAANLRIVDAGREEQEYAQRGLVRLAIPSPVLDNAMPGRNGTLRFTRDDDTAENAKQEQDFSYVSEFLGYLEDSAYADAVTCVDLREKQDVHITLDSRYRIDFGRVRDKQDFAQKLETFEQILAQGNLDPEGKYIILLWSEDYSLIPANDRDLDLVD